MSLISGLVLGAAAGAGFVYFRFRGRASGALGVLQRERENERSTWERRLAERERELSETQERVVGLSGSVAAERERNASLEKRLSENRQELEQLNQRMTTEFKLIANELLETKGRQLGEQQHERLDSLLKPLKERIKEFEEQVKRTYQEEERERFALKKEIMRLVEQNQRLSQDASDLTRALKGDAQAQGAWGEMLLEKLLESAGLVKGQEYSLQESTTLADGSRLRPDAVVMLPEGKHLIIDAKVSLLHYERFTAHTDPGDRERLLKQHVESLRTHAKGLGEKDYAKLYDLGAVDFVLMFIPIEPAFLLALRERPEIFQEAYDRGVVIVTHSTLMATLRTVASIWKSERISRNHMEIAQRAGALHDKFVGFTEDLIKVGQQMDTAKRTYSDAMNKLSEGSGNLVRQVKMLEQLGAKAGKSLNAALLARAMEEENTREDA